MFPAFHVGSFIFYTYGLMLGLAIVLGMLMIRADFARHHILIPALPFTIALVLLGLIGSKLDTEVVKHLRTGSAILHGTPQEWIGRGHTWLGAQSVALLAFLLFARIYRVSPLKVLDTFPVTALSYALGRIGCFLSGDGDYGPPTSVPWAISFPHGLVPTSMRVHPTMLYIALWEIFLFLIFWRRGRTASYKLLPWGTLFSEYLLLSSLGRILSECLSINPKVIGRFTEAQIESICFAIIGATVYALCWQARISPQRNQRVSQSLHVPDLHTGHN